MGASRAGICWVLQTQLARKTTGLSTGPSVWALGTRRVSEMSLSGTRANGRTGKTPGGQRLSPSPHSRVTQLRLREGLDRPKHPAQKCHHLEQTGSPSSFSEFFTPARPARGWICTHLPPCRWQSSRGRAEGLFLGTVQGGRLPKRYALHRRLPHAHTTQMHTHNHSDTHRHIHTKIKQKSV